MATASTVPSRRAFAFVMITVFLDMVGFGIIIPVLPQLIGTVGQVSLSEAAVIGGWMGAVYCLAQFFGGPLIGNLSDRFGRRPLLLLAVFGLGFEFLIQALAPTLGWLFFGRLVAGFCGGSWILANAYVADITPPEDRGRVYGIMGAAFGLGFIIGPAIGGLLGTFGPRVPFYVAAAVSVANFIFGLFILPETLAPQHRRPFEWRRANPFGAFRIFASYRDVLPMCLVMGLFFFFTSIYGAIWPFWGKARFDWSEAMIGLTLAAFGIVMAAFQGLLSGRFVTWFGERKTVAIGLASAGIALLGYGWVWSLPLVLLLMFVHGPEGFVQPMLSALMSKRVPENAQGELQGGLSAIMNVAMMLGTVFFAQIFGYFMSDAAPFQSSSPAFVVAGIGVLATLGVFLWRIGNACEDGDGAV